jgi:hypothetical protein
MPAYVLAALIVAAAPVTLAVKSTLDSDSDDADSLVSVVGRVTAYVVDHDEYENETGDHDNEADDAEDEGALGDFEDASVLSHQSDEPKRNHTKVITAFVIDNETIVTCGPWWYWAAQETNITDVVHIGDIVNVTGEMEDENGMNVLCAWKIVNNTTGEELTIKEEGRPPWAGGPKALVLLPWPSEEDE